MPHTHTHSHTLQCIVRAQFFGHLSLGPNWISSSNCRAAAIIFWFECMRKFMQKKEEKKMKHYIKIASNQQQHKSETKTSRWRERRKTISSLAAQRKSGKSRFAAAATTTTTTFTQRRRRIFLEASDGHERKWAQPNSWARRKKVKNEQASECVRERESETCLPSCAYEQRVRKLFASARMQQRRRQRSWQRSSLMGQTVRDEGRRSAEA